jgi:hypothetical protein
LVLFAGVIEARLAWRGYTPTTVDSPELWAAQRSLADRLGKRALILTGGSRIHLAADLDVLHEVTRLEPVQLAVDGGSFIPVLEDLARDRAVTGTVIVDVSDHLLIDRDPRDPAFAYVRGYRSRKGAAAWSLFDDSERWLTRMFRGGLRSYADGASPMNSLHLRLLADVPVPQFLVTQRDRSRYMDYRKLPMPEYYLGRVMRNLGLHPGMARGVGNAELEAELRRRIENVAPMLDRSATYLEEVIALRDMAARIRNRGGRVYFVKMPTSGLITLLEERRFPRTHFWDELARNVDAPAVHFEDVPVLRTFECPDGSHLDMRDRARFTAALAEALGIGGQ